jgi:hypothetical protein
MGIARLQQFRTIDLRHGYDRAMADRLIAPPDHCGYQRRVLCKYSTKVNRIPQEPLAVAHGSPAMLDRGGSANQLGSVPVTFP